MFKLQNFLRQCVLIVSLGCAATMAQANPTQYHVSINTAALGTNGSVDASLASAGFAAELNAALSNFSAGFNGVDSQFSGDYQTTPSGFSLTNGAGYNYLSQLVTFGSVLSFDVTFSGPFFNVVGNEASAFAIDLYDASGVFIGNAVSFAFPSTGADLIVVTNGLGNATLVDPNAVPEPGELVLMLTALALMGVMMRRRA